MLNVALVPAPSVIPTAIKALRASSITSPAVKLTIILPLYIYPTPTAKTLEIVAPGILVPFRRTEKVTVVPSAAEAFNK